MMDRFEQELREGLRRKTPSPDFAARVLAQVDADAEVQGWRHWFRGPVLAGAVAIILVALAIGIGAERRHQERLAGEQARQQVVLALHIASSKLHLAETKVQQLSVNTQE